jgi:hypothetical protein
MTTCSVRGCEAEAEPGTFIGAFAAWAGAGVAVCDEDYVALTEGRGILIEGAPDGSRAELLLVDAA